MACLVMNMRTMLFCPWFGPFPSFWEKFVDRIKAQGDRLDLLVPTDQVRTIATDRNVFYSPWTFPKLITLMRQRLDCDIREDLFEGRGGYKLCDLRPMMGEVFNPTFYEFWGWIDADVVLGDWSMIMARAIDVDIYSTASGIVNGPLTVLRNTPKNNRLFQHSMEWVAALNDQAYTAFDEIGFTKIVRERAAKGDVRFLAEYVHTHSGMNDRTLEEPGVGLLPDGKLFDSIQGREVAYFHFPHWKAWPILETHGNA